MLKFTKKVPLAGSERTVLPGVKDKGPVPAGETVSVSIYLRSRGHVPEPSATAPGTAHAVPHLDSKEVMNQFAATPEDIALVVEFAKAHNLQVVEASPEKRSVKVSGTAADVANAFGVQLHQYAHADGKTYRGRQGAVNIPTELAGVVEAVFGLDNRKMARSYRALRMRQIARADSAALPDGTFLPTDLAALYNFPANTDGAGQVIGILTFNDRLGGYSQDALDTYYKSVLKMAAPPKIIDVVVDGPGNVPSTSTDPDNVTGEVMLDAQVIGSLAPAAKVVMYFTEFTEQGWVDVVHTVVADDTNNPSVLSISYGNPEDASDSAWTRAAITQVNKAFSAAAAKGITICCASGDDGSRDQARDNRAHADYPASDPFVLGVGGTSVKASNGQITSEVVWNDREGAGGGGISTIFGIPDFQKNIAFLKKPPARHKPGRGVPDVSANADPETGYVIIDVDGQHLDITGGTSAAAPLWAALICRLNQALGTRLGYINPLLYGALASGVLRDITQGNIGGYRAAAGWDPSSGLGAPDGEKLLAALKPGTQVASAT
jgi:kumamolisin